MTRPIPCRRLSSCFPPSVLVAGIAVVVALEMSETALGNVLAPLFAACAISVLFWRSLTIRDQGLPIFELGAFFMLATAAYTVLPLARYVLGGMQFSVLSHQRLYQLNPTPGQFAEAGWMYVVFMATFALGYLGLRRHDLATALRLEPVPYATGVVAVFLWLFLNSIVLFLRFAYGINFFVAYDESLYEAAAVFAQLPLIARQLVPIAYGLLTILNVVIIVMLVARWKSRLWRNALFVWIAASCLNYLLNPGGRFALFSMLIAFVMAFHRFVRPIRISEVLLGSLILFGAFIGAGFARGGSSLLEQGQAMLDLLDGYQTLFTVSDEFQNAYGSLLEFKHNLEHGLLDPVPWQIYAADILMTIPQQILPFEKLEPVEWYVGVTQNPDYFNFSVFAQAVLGFGWGEIALRGGIWGFALAIIHNWWARKPSTLWRTVFYIWVTVVSYQTVRNTSFYLVPLILYRFLPLLLIVRIGEWLFEGAASARSLHRALGRSPP